jgi:predicted GH43/DUF377 family glycosyl hydrolase
LRSGYTLLVSTYASAHTASTGSIGEPTFERLGIVGVPSGGNLDRNGTINPGSARRRDGRLVLLPRTVAPGNVSRIACWTSTWNGDAVAFAHDGLALEPDVPYERRSEPGGYGCEDPRVTFVPTLDRYLMAYCAYGPSGARVALAVSSDAHTWTRLGLVDFHGKEGLGDKDAAFLPEIVASPRGVPSYALLHRPTFHEWVARGRCLVPAILATPPSQRESICISYIPAAAVESNLAELLDVREVAVLMRPDGAWGSIKVGTGTPPVRTPAGWMFMYHGIDPLPGHERSDRPAMQYRAGVALLDIATPHKLLYRSPQPVLSPELPEEREGQVDDVVFPTAIDPRPDIGQHAFDIYYGMGDRVTGRGRLSVDTSALSRTV